MGRGLVNNEHKIETMHLTLFSSLNEPRNSSLKRAAILKVEEENSYHMALIKVYLKVRYSLDRDIYLKTLVEAQKAMLYNEIDKRTNHKKLFKARTHDLVSIRDSSTWLIKGNNQARSEAIYCIIQDIIFFVDRKSSVVTRGQT